jgi:hypothetical protein
MRFQIYGWDGSTPTSNTASLFAAPAGADIRTGANQSLTFRVRTMLTFDSRAQTAYGTLRAVTTAGYTNDINSSPATQTIYANRGFIQIAGFTLGKAVSFFDFYSAPATTYFATATGDTGDGGWIVAAYTAQFGGGLSASLSVEEPRRTFIISAPGAAGLGAATGGIAVGTLTGPTYTNNYVQQRMPDFVANLRWDQPWGSIQIMGALHDAGAGYYSAPGAPPLIGNGHPGNELGWAAGGGVKLRFGPDSFDSQFTYTQGALRYLIHAQNAAGYYQFRSSDAIAGTVGGLGYGFFSDGVHGLAGTSIELTTGWALNLSYDHRWSPTLKTSIYGSYISVSYNGVANATLCAAGGSTAVGSPGLFVATGVCDNDWQLWYIGSRTQWDVAKGFYVGVDVLYQKLQTASGGGTTGVTFSPGGGRPSGAYAIKDQDNWAVTFRAHRDIIP